MTPNYPTTETLYQGTFHYEISHRFVPPINRGYKANFGFDGPANIRTSVSYGLGDRLMLTLGRSNVLDNLDLQLRYRWLQFHHERFPAVLVLNAGAAWNTEMPAIVDRSALAADNFQYYGQLVLNTMVADKLGLGLVPSCVYNSTIFSVDPQYTVTLGTYVQYFINHAWGILLEYSPALAGYQGILSPGESGRSHHSLAWGLCLDTGGHTFYLIATNNTRLSPPQYLVGPPTTRPRRTGALASASRGFCRRIPSMLKYALVLGGCMSAFLSCASDKLLTPDELDEILTVESVAFEPKGEVISAEGSVDLSLFFGKLTRCTVLVRNSGDGFDSDEGVKMTIIVYDAEGRALDSASTTQYGILGNGRATLFEVGLEPPHDQIDEDRYEVNFEGRRKD